jgi:hypothetical protein
MWYLHWKLVEAPSHATAWRYVFTLFPEREFTVDQLQAALGGHVAKTYPTARAAATSLRKDILCVIRMYAQESASAPINEENIASPFADLGLIQAGAEPRTYAFDLGEKTHLPDLVVITACLEYAAAVSSAGRTIGLGRLLYDAGSPGMAFKLTESALVAVIERVAAHTSDVALADTAGLVQLSYGSEPASYAKELLATYYNDIRTNAFARGR